VNFRKAWSRLAHLSWDELNTRLGQAARKRVDLASYRCGLNTGDEAVVGSAPHEPRFFFRKDEIQGRGELWRRLLPREAETLVREADDIRRHRFHLLGYEKLDYGAQIDWHLDAVHGKRAPLKPWFKIDFLDFLEVGDHKVVWELNRHQHLATLAKAWILTADKAYVDELLNQWYGWQKANPYPLGINWASTLEVAFRSLSWLWIRNLLAGCQDIPATFPTELISALRKNGRYIERYLSKYFSPNTHLLGEAVALFYIGTLCPEIAEAKRWRQLGWKIVVRESEHQVRLDGVYFEQALYYHVYALDFFLYARMLAARNGILIPETFDNVVGKMLDVLQALSESGAVEGFGDDDGGRVFNPRRNRVEHMTDPLLIGAVEYQRAQWATATGLTEEALWLFGESALTVFSGEPSRIARSSRAFESGGIYLISDEEPVPQQMMIDAGPQGAGNSGHGHADALSIRFTLDGHRCLIDPGTCCYISEGDDRALFRGTGVHNTLRIDGLDQAVPEGPFAWSSVPQVRVQQWLSGETFDLFEGHHDGYRRLPDSVTHRRIIFHVKGAFWLVRDIAEAKQAHLLETFWHFSPELRVSGQEGAVTSSLAESASRNGSPSRAKLVLLLAQDQVWQTEVAFGNYSPAYGLKQPAPVARFSATIRLPAESGVLLVPLASGAGVGRFAEIDRGAPIVRAYRYDEQGQTTHHIFFSERTENWSCGAWSSDAQLLYCRLVEGRLAQMAVVGGSFAKWQDTVLVRHREKVERFEWIYFQRTLKTFSSRSAALEYAIDSSCELLDRVC
jgi:heparinase II/III-like protein